MILGILQARVTSSRLPGKVLKPILGKAMLELQIERVRRARGLDRLIVATSVENADDPLMELCSRLDVECFRGSLDDVLDRFYYAARPYAPDTIVRLTGDCPLCDPSVIDQTVKYHLEGGFDYSGNAVEPTFPDGLDVEVFGFECLIDAWHSAELKSEREHVTLYFRNHPEKFKIGVFNQEIDMSYLRWTVDEPEDFRLVEAVYEELYPVNPEFDMKDVLGLLERHPILKTINRQFQRNEGLLKSQREDKKMKS